MTASTHLEPIAASSGTSGAPRTVHTRYVAFVAFAALACLGIGCSTSTEAATSDLLAEESPLEQVGLADVEAASSSCEDLLAGVTDFALLGETGLVVGLDSGGGAVCIDTVDAVNDELSEDGRISDALALAARYQNAMAIRQATGRPVIRRFVLGGDPDPEPNSPMFHQPTERPGI
jgi:hypothetical protein